MGIEDRLRKLEATIEAMTDHGPVVVPWNHWPRETQEAVLRALEDCGAIERTDKCS